LLIKNNDTQTAAAAAAAAADAPTNNAAAEARRRAPQNGLVGEVTTVPRRRDIPPPISRLPSTHADPRGARYQFTARARRAARRETVQFRSLKLR